MRTIRTADLQKLEIRLITTGALASLTVWGNGACDWDVMHKTTGQFVEHAWGLKLNGQPIEHAFARFLSLALPNSLAQISRLLSN